MGKQENEWKGEKISNTPQKKLRGAACCDPTCTTCLRPFQPLMPLVLVCLELSLSPWSLNSCDGEDDDDNYLDQIIVRFSSKGIYGEGRRRQGISFPPFDSLDVVEPGLMALRNRNLFWSITYNWKNYNYVKLQDRLIEEGCLNRKSHASLKLSASRLPLHKR